MAYRPQEVAQRLAISPSTLRLWSNHFAENLSEQARKVADGGALAAQRRYTDEDLATLLQAKELLAQGLTYEEAKPRLRQPSGKQTTLVAGRQEEAPAHLQEEVRLSLASLRETLEAKEKTIEALKESLAFLDVYLRTVLREREDARARERQLQRELDRIRAEIQEPEAELAKPWWKRLLALP